MINLILSKMTLKQWIFVLMAGLVLPGMGFGQVDEELSKKYPVDLGNLKLSTNYVNFKYIKDTEVKADSILIYNNWDQSMEIAPVSLPAYLKVTVNPATLAREPVAVS